MQENKTPKIKEKVEEEDVQEEKIEEKTPKAEEKIEEVKLTKAEEKVQENKTSDKPTKVEEKVKEDKMKKVFGLYDLSEIKIEDPGLKRYLNLDVKLVLKSRGRGRERFAKAKINIIERFVNIISVPGHRGKKHKIITNWASGKYSKNMKVMLETLKILENQKKENPVQILVRAIEHAAPRDEITVIEYGGARYPQAVDMSPSRRITVAVRNIVHGAYDMAFNKKTKIQEALAKEITLASDGNMESFAMKKKNESERQADSAR